MRLLKENARVLNQFCSMISQRSYSKQVNPEYPYTSDLYKKNYIKYSVQSKSAISHDYVYTGDERLKTLKDRLIDFNNPNDELVKDIGKSTYYTKLGDLKKKISNTIKKNKNDKRLEKLAKDLELNVPIDQIEAETKLFKHFRDQVQIANHYNINKDLFGRGFFRPSLDLNVKYNEGKGVFYGNRLTPADSANKPEVSWSDIFEASKVEDRYHTLMLVNLDGNFQDNNEEVLLWFVANSKGTDITSGQELKQYIQPFPMRGTGWHRCAYVLFEHESPIDFEMSQEGEVTFDQRRFSSKKFFSKHENVLTPVGLSFFQTEWDLSVRKFFHNVLDMKEPVYEFDHGPKFMPRFEKFAHGQAFNWYLQEYNDRKEINEHVMKDYLKGISPFAGHPEPAKYPSLDLQIVKPRWFKYELENKRLRKHEWNIAPYKYSHGLEKKKESLKHLPYQ